MRTVGPRLGSALPHLLLVTTVAELAFYRLAVPALRPPGDQPPPIWHHVLSYAGLFLFYFASTLAIGALFAHLVQLVRRPGAVATPLRQLLIVSGAAFITFALVSLASVPTDRLQFLLEGAFTLSLLILILAQPLARGDIGARVGMVLFAVPLVMHFYGPLSVRFISGEEVLWEGLPEKLQALGQWSLVFAALASPYCFAPRPISRSITRIAPLAVAVFVGLVGTVILRQNYEVGMELAMLGLGIDLGPGAPTSVIALYLMALVAGTWTLVSCLTAEGPERRRIGVGIGLVFVGGYAFQWPLHYLASMVGLLTIGDAAGDVAGEEQDRSNEGGARRFRAPPIAAEAWQAYVAAAVEALRGEGEGKRERAGEGEGQREGEGRVSAVSVRGEDGITRTHVAGQVFGRKVRLTVERYEDSIVAIDVLCGDEPEGQREPAWTLVARSERRLGLGNHPEAPACSAPIHKTGDHAFDRRFRLRDGGDLTQELLDDGLRARATALIDGWIALWPGRALRYRVYPGRGAPLDHPIPITELAFRGAEVPVSVERLITLLRFLTELWGQTPATSPTESRGS